MSGGRELPFNDLALPERAGILWNGALAVESAATVAHRLGIQRVIRAEMGDWHAVVDEEGALVCVVPPSRAVGPNAKVTLAEPIAGAIAIRDAVNAAIRLGAAAADAGSPDPAGRRVAELEARVTNLELIIERLRGVL